MKRIVPALLITLSVISGAQAQAQPAQETEITAFTQQAYRLGEVQRELANIQQLAIKQNPELQQLTEQANQQLQHKAEQQGYDPQAFEAILAKARENLAKENISEEERVSIMQELEDERSAHMKKRAEFLAEPEVKQINEKLRTEILIAMKKTNPDTKALLEEMRVLNSVLNEQ